MKNRWLLTALMAMAIALGVNKPISVLSQTTIEQEQQRQEAESLSQQASQLISQGKYKEAIPIVEKFLVIAKNILGSNHFEVAANTSTLAILYYYDKKYDKAESLFHEALNIFDNLSIKDHPDIADTWHNLGLVYYDQKKYEQAEPLLLQALELRKKLLGELHPHVAVSTSTLATLYYYQQRYSEAEPLFIRALDIFNKLSIEESDNVAATKKNLAYLYDSQGRYEEAKTLLFQALEINRKLYGKIHPSVVSNLEKIAFISNTQGKYEETEKFYLEALEINKKIIGIEHPDIAQSFNNLAFFYVNHGRYVEAEPYYLQALEVNKQLYGEEHPTVALNLTNLAALYLNQVRNSEAEPLLIQALEIYKNLPGEEELYATSLNNLGVFYSKPGTYPKAKRLHLQALKLRKKLFGEESISVTDSINNIALINFSEENYEQAEKQFIEALNLRKTLLGDENYYTATSRSNLAELYIRQGRYFEAQELHLQALKIRKETLDARHPAVGESLNNLALTNYAQGDIEQTIDYLNQGVQVQEYNLSYNLVAGSERQKLDYINSISGTYDALISLNLQSAPENQISTRLALTTILQRKGRILDFLTDSLQILRQQTNDTEIKDLITKLNLLRTEQSNLAINTKYGEIQTPDNQLQQLEAKELEAKELEDKLSRRSAEFRKSTEPITLENIQQLIPQDSALVELVRYRTFNLETTEDKRWNAPRYAAYVLHPQNEPQAIDLGAAETIEQAVTKFRNHLQNKESNIDKQLKRSGRELDELVMKPIRQLLGDTTDILISPDGVLNLIPFEALVDESNQYLIDKYNFTYLTSGRDLLRIAAEDKPTFQQPGIIMADPLFNREGQSVIAQTRSFDISKQIFERLDGTAVEAKEVFSLFPNANKPLTRSFATENALKQVKQPHFLHIATHGFFVDKKKNDENALINDNPLLRSGLVFAGVKKGSSAGDDGALTSLEATTLDLRGTQLVVLSACDTGVGEVTTGEGIYGLRRAFVLAGSESQVISLWKVDDTATKEIMVNYYQRLKNNEGRSLALHEVQREMLKSEKYQHPYYWASFIPSGDWSKMNTTK